MTKPRIKPPSAGAFRMVHKPGEFALQISMNFTPEKAKEWWTEIPAPVKIDQSEEPKP